MFLVIGFGTFATYAVGEKLISEVRRLPLGRSTTR